jgi:hypothetical protein
MPRGAKPGDGRMRAAIAAAAALKHQEMVERIATGKQVCPHCRRLLPLETGFTRAPSNASGWASWCRECVTAQQRERRRTEYRKCAECGKPRPSADFTGDRGQVVRCCPACRARKARTSRRKAGHPPGWRRDAWPDTPAIRAAVAAAQYRPAGRVTVAELACCTGSPRIAPDGVFAGVDHSRGCVFAGMAAAR